MDPELLEERARIIRRVRAFFDEQSYLEVDTPLLAPDLIPESCLEVFATRYRSPNRMSKPYWLVPSPEIWMKRLIGRLRRNIYQIGKCFRNGESTGRLHSPEFTMLEYYTMDAGYLDSLRVTEELFAALGVLPAELRPPFLRITIEEAFSRWAGFSLLSALEGRNTRERLEEEAGRIGLSPPAGLRPGALYDLIFIHAVEPALPRDQPVVLLDYPSFIPCLAQQGSGGKTVERWELYVNGIELANCYSEETEPELVRRYFESEAAIKASALEPHRIDADYWKVFLPARSAGGVSEGAPLPYPRCSGVALGMDRLVMALTGRASIDAVLPFPMTPRDHSITRELPL